MNSSNLNKSKLTLPAGFATPKNNRLRSELRRVMSDRVLKITRCSQQQNVEKIKQRQDSSTSTTPTLPLSASQTSLCDSAKSKPADLSKLIGEKKSPLISPSTTAVVSSQTKTNTPSPTSYRQIVLGKDSTPKFLPKVASVVSSSSSFALAKTSPESNENKSNKISLQPIKTFDLKDKNSLIKHIQTVYNDVLDSNGSIVLAVQSVSNSITHYTQANNLDTKTFMGEILKEGLFKSNIDLKQKYKNNEQCDKFKLEGQIQILLQIENYIASNANKTKVDEDWVWEIANSMRWLKQAFKDFKIEKFLFGEIYANYFQNAPDFIVSLMEELGYDKDDNTNESTTTTPSESPCKKYLNDSNSEQKEPINANITRLLTHSASNPAISHLMREDSNSNFSFTGGVNSLFEDEERTTTNNDSDLVENDEQSQAANLDDGDKLLNDLKKKKPTTRFPDFSQSSARSIVVQRKRTKLKIRSPYKSPSKSFQNRRVIATEAASRRSPRIKEKLLLDTACSQKRPRTYLITDTPDHKQNATIITTRQEKLRKRFSFQQFNTQANPLPIIPDTPVKNENRNTEHEAPVVTANPISISMQKLYASPKKNILFR